MTTNTSNAAPLNATYAKKNANGDVKVVMTTKKRMDIKPKPVQGYVKTHYSIDTNGGGYAGL